ncbi:MAG: hypothetical protein J5486_05895 [Bacteroidaceae bacterium]|nr:hypothetical protein [Bacteroidaceae bacterium]
MKKILTSLTAAIAILSLSSCVTLNSGAALADKAPVGPKMGEAKSSIILGTWSSKGEQNNIQVAARNGGITKVSQVEYIDKSVLFGLFIQHTTRVYGE